MISVQPNFESSSAAFNSSLGMPGGLGGAPAGWEIPPHLRSLGGVSAGRKGVQRNRQISKASSVLSLPDYLHCIASLGPWRGLGIQQYPPEHDMAEQGSAIRLGLLFLDTVSCMVSPYYIMTLVSSSSLPFSSSKQAIITLFPSIVAFQLLVLVNTD